MKSRTAAQRPIAGRGFVAVQVALSVVLVVLAALLSQSLMRLQHERTGFELDHVTIQTAPFHLLGRQGDGGWISTTAWSSASAAPPTIRRPRPSPGTRR